MWGAWCFFVCFGFLKFVYFSWGFFVIFFLQKVGKLSFSCLTDTQEEFSGAYFN